MQTVSVKLMPKQYAAVSCADEWAATRGGVGSGKSVGWAWWAWMRMEEYPSANTAVMAADYVQARDGFFQTFQAMLERQGLEQGRDYAYRESPTPRLRLLHNGATLHSLSAKKAQKLRSIEVQTLVLEEPQTWDRGEELYEIIVERLRHSDRTARIYGDELIPQGRMSFNPPPEGHWLHQLITQRWAERGWKCWRMSVRENTLMTGRDRYIRNIESQIDQSRWPSEIDGHWATAGGNAYSSFDSKIHLVAPDGMPAVDAIDETKPLLWAHDFNVALMCSLIAQPYSQTRLTDGFEYHPNRSPTQLYRFPITGWQRRIIRVVGELAIPDAGTPNVFRAFMERWGDIALRTGVVLFGDASGGARQQSQDSASSGRTNWLDLETRLRKAGIKVSLQIPKANPSEIDRRNETNAQFGTGEGHGVTINGPECPTLLKDLREVKIGKNGKIEKLPGTLLTHMSDGLGYLCYRQRELGRLADLKSRENRRGSALTHMQR